MPRLVGRRSSVKPYFVSVLLVAIAAGGALQYLGVVDFRHVGREMQNLLQSSSSFDQGLSHAELAIADQEGHHA
jgi:hypothetical protein